MRINDHEAFDVLDIVETNYSGRLTRHIVAARFKARKSQSGIAYEVVPTVRGSDANGTPGRLDHGWFKRVGRLVLTDGAPTMASAK